RHDLRDLPEGEREAEALRLATADATRPIPLDRPPLFRARLVRMAEERYRLYLTLSHIIFDGVAIYRVVLPELAALYEAPAGAPPGGGAPPLAGRRSTPPACVGGGGGGKRGAGPPADLVYWRDKLGGALPVLDLPFDRPRPAVFSFRGSMHPFILEEDLAR